MKVTFPHMGNTYLAGKALFEDLGVDVVLPLPNTKRTLEIGTKYAPETICLPLKINLGNYIESIERGADTIIVTGSNGPCRYGYYAEVHKEILKDLGYDIEFVVMEVPEGDMKEFYRRLCKITNTNNVWKMVKAFKNAFRVLKKADQFEATVLKFRPYEKNKGEIDSLYRRLLKELEESHGSHEMLQCFQKAFQDLKDVSLDKKRDVLKIGIIGEIYTIIEDFVNLDIGKKLNDLGAEVHKSHSVSGWVIEHAFYRTVGRSREYDIRKAAQPYMRTFIGGHAQETIGHAVLYAQKGYDGAIQIMPFSCMPEIVAMSILPQVQKDWNIPILTLVVDEMTGEAGFITRLEAYVELLRNRKERQRSEALLSWN
ncbi:MAG TPA: CoA protein activase [Clostridiales bacterium]|nr:CoA protein activase [Clostridiales bacterium]